MVNVRFITAGLHGWHAFWCEQERADRKICHSYFLVVSVESFTYVYPSSSWDATKITWAFPLFTYLKLWRGLIHTYVCLHNLKRAVNTVCCRISVTPFKAFHNSKLLRQALHFSMYWHILDDWWLRSVPPSPPWHQFWHPLVELLHKWNPFTIMAWKNCHITVISCPEITWIIEYRVILMAINIIGLLSSQSSLVVTATCGPLSRLTKCTVCYPCISLLQFTQTNAGNDWATHKT